MRALWLAAFAAVTGCACMPAAVDAPKAATGADCPAVRRADAWVNRMPGPERADRALIVLLELESDQRWTLQRVEEASADGHIRLNLIPGGHGHPGSASWRQPGSEAPRVIDIFCGEAPHYSISKITSAY